MPEVVKNASLYNVDEVAKITGLSERTIRSRIDEGKIKVISFARRIFIEEDDLIIFLRNTLHLPKGDEIKYINHRLNDENDA